MIFDSHAHYDDEAFNEEREAILNSLPKNGISPIVNVSAQLSGVTATSAIFCRIYGIRSPARLRYTG